MRKRSLVALLAIATFATAIVAGLGSSAAFAGEVTGNCPTHETGNGGGNGKSDENCKGQEEGGGTRVSNGGSWCSFSGQNDDPTEEGAGGRTQNWGHTAQPNTGDPDIPDPSTLQGGAPSPGTTCNSQKPGGPGPGAPESPTKKQDS